MKIISNSNTFFTSVVKYKKSSQYKFSQYNIKLFTNNKYYVFNMLSKSFVELDVNEYESINKITSNMIQTLFDCNIIVPTDINEFEIAKQVKTLIKLLPQCSEISSYTIFTTTDCNARCFYCFEKNANKQHMNEVVAEDVAKYICNNYKKNNKKVNLCWFGGEPLYNIYPINIICDFLTENKIPFSSTMISNGYLFDYQTIQIAKSKWNLKSVQITLDGTEKIYNSIKAYIYKDHINPFDKVLKNIDLLLDFNIAVSVRLNVTNENIEDLYDLVKLLNQRFKNSFLTIFPCLLYPTKEEMQFLDARKKRNQLTKKFWELEDYIFNIGKLNIKEIPYKYKVNNCIADSMESITILPNGNIGKCEHKTNSDFIGSIYNDKFDVANINKWKTLCDTIELCKICPFYPQCEKLKYCEGTGMYECDNYTINQKIRQIKHSMFKALNKYRDEKNAN